MGALYHPQAEDSGLLTRRGQGGQRIREDEGEHPGRAQETFRPEFINRIDEVIVFHSLDDEHLRQIVPLMLQNAIDRLKQRDIHLEISDAAKDYMAKEGFDPVYGARPLRRAIQRTVEDNLSEEILAGRISVGDKVLIDVENDKLVFKKI